MQKPNLAQLLATLREDERIIAAEALDRYLELAWEVWEDMNAREDSP